MANEREKQYKHQRKDLYLFAVDALNVIDSTNCGSVARFMNHSCSPSTFTKIVTLAAAKPTGQAQPQEEDKSGSQEASAGASQVPKLAFFARCDILVGQELTYDYRLKEEDDENKIACRCGAPNCKGTIN